MGDEIGSSQFSDEDYQAYYAQLEIETLTLEKKFNEKKLSSISNYCGLEQEAWILNSDNFPVPENQFLLDSLNNSLLSPELAQFNIELNVTPQLLTSDGLSKMQSELEALWNLCDSKLQKKNLHMEMIGILPTVRDAELIVKNMSSMKRYRALNEQVLKSRNGEALSLNIVGIEHLKSTHNDVMLESAATSLQLHRQIESDSSARYYNTAIILSAITVAISANSPLLFGKQLWEETRIPLFEQAVDVGGYGNAMHGPIKRVSFGSGYVRNSIFECFSENLEHYPVLLPVKLDKADNKFPYLRMHNGTIWRWNRPIIGFDEDGTTHLRIEHRVMSAGPTIIDEISNAAFFYGLQEFFANHPVQAEKLLSFSEAKNNFYTAAQHGIESKINWPSLDNKKLVKISIRKLIKTELLQCSRQGLESLGIDKHDIDRYLEVIEGRVSTGQTGSAWQKSYLLSNGFRENISDLDASDGNMDVMKSLIEAYSKNRLIGNPVHMWPL